MLDARITKRLAAAKGVSLHRGKLRIAFTLPGEHQQTKRSLGIDPTVRNIDFAEMKLAEIKMDILRGTFSWEKHFPNDPKSRAENPTLAEALQRFYLDIGHWRASSERIAHSKATRLNELLPGKYLRDLNEEALQRLRKRLLVTTSRRHVNLLMSVLQQVMTRAVRARVSCRSTSWPSEMVGPSASKPSSGASRSRCRKGVPTSMAVMPHSRVRKRASGISS